VVPTLDDVRKLRQAIKNASDVEYVFSKFRSPKWTPLLAEEGFFSSPYKPEPQANGMLFPAWPPSRFLARLAAEHQSREDQEAMVTVALQIPETSNVRVHLNLAETALGLDPDLASRLAPLVADWLRSPYHLGLPRAAGALVSHLAKGGRADVALRLAEALLAVEEDPRSKELDADESGFRDLRQPTARFDLWEYEQILNKNILDTVDAAGEQTMGLLCDLLDRAVLLSNRRGAERRPEDLSRIWRPAIEDNQQNLNLGVKDLLVSAVRNAAEQMARKEPTSVRRLVAFLEERGKAWAVFRRIALHVLRVFPDAAPELVRERLLDRALSESPDVRHEYFLLQKDCFGRLTGDERTTILSWIDHGPPHIDSWLKIWEETTGQPATPETRTSFIRQWKRDRLNPLEEYLDAAWRETYATLVAQTGPARHPEFTSYSEAATWGLQSPQSSEHLGEKPIGDLVSYLANWKPTGHWPRRASPEGLGREITAAVSQDPQRYAHAAVEFEQLEEPTYIRAIIQGFDGALKNGSKFDWRPVLELCSWAATRQRDIPGRGAGPLAEEDPHWGWTRTAVLRLLINGFLSASNPIPQGLRDPTWRAIEPTTNDPDPTPEQEEKYLKGAVHEEYRKWGAKVMSPDPLTSAINSVRGTAIEATVQYALWLRKAFEQSPERGSMLTQGLDAMPEVRRVLDRHLNTATDPSLSIRAVYGQRLPWLQLLDRKWTDDNTARLLPRSEPELWHAAWDTYICHCAPYDNVFDWLRNEYAFAVEQLGTHQHKWDTPQPPDYSLSKHLMSLYWRGKLDYRDSILEAFYHRADVKLRGYALNFAGRSLRDTKEPIPDEIAERLKNLWTNRLAAAKRGSTAAAEELKEYGWWFASGKLEDQWSIRQLLEALHNAKQVDPDFMVVERLAQMSQAFPLESIEALRTIVEADVKGWGILGWSDKAKEIIRAARKSASAKARQKAEALVNLIGSRGHFDFGELLKEPTE
jgi:hypothetical protein